MFCFGKGRGQWEGSRCQSMLNKNHGIEISENHIKSRNNGKP